MKKKVLIIGASGLVGYTLYEHFSKEYDVIGTYNTHPINNLIHLNIINKHQLENLLKKSNPDIILLPAALSAVDYCEKNKEECWQYNVTGPHNLIKLASKSQIKLIFYSTDYIFDGKNGPYTEEDTPNPLNNYGKAKLQTEENIINELEDYLILRITVVYGWEHLGKNFIFRLINNQKKGEIIRVPKDQVGSPTYVENIAEATLELIKLDKIGIYNVAGLELMDRYSFALTAADVFHLDKLLIKPLLTAELNQIAARPLNAGLIIDKLTKTIKVKMLAPREGLEQMKQNKKGYMNISL